MRAMARRLDPGIAGLFAASWRVAAAGNSGSSAGRTLSRSCIGWSRCLQVACTHHRRRSATPIDLYPPVRGLKPTATFDGRTATGEPGTLPAIPPDISLSGSFEVSVGNDSEKRRQENPPKVYPTDSGLIPVLDRSAKANTGHALEHPDIT